jgi:hypothetical protein
MSTMPKKKHYKKHSFLAKWWRRYEYKHSTLAIVSIIGFVLLLDTALVQTVLDSIERLEVLGVFIAGVLFVSFFTAAPAVILLLDFLGAYNPFIIALVAGAGAAIGDLIIFTMLEDKIGYELKPLAKKFRLMKFINSLHKKKARLRTILIGSFIIASPLPDEAGIALLGLSHISAANLLVITFLLNAAGILVILLGVTLGG